MTRYFRTESGYVSTEDDAIEAPPEWTEITAEEYAAILAAEAQAAADAEAAVLAAANDRWVKVHDDLVGVAGVSDEVAVLLANAVGIRPA